MKTKFFARAIRIKFEEWLATIKDPKVQSMAKDNTIFTGGCIASMFLGEKVNDFDIYFRDEETTKAVIEYYIKQFKEISVKLNPLNRDRVKRIEVYKHDKGGIRIKVPSAGISSVEQEKEYRFFENDELGLDTLDFLDNATSVAKLELDQKLRDEYGKFIPVFISENAITLTDKIQIIGRFYGEVEMLHDNFDYVHATNYWDSKTGQLIVKQDALESLLNKELKYIGSRYPLTSIVRMRKFIKRGWKISAGQILKMCFQIAELDLQNVEVLREQLIGVDVAYFNELIKIVEAAKKEKGADWKLDYTYLAELIERLF